MENPTGNKAIARNTLFLYIRMLITMIISLYTSRVILQILGIDDYGIYQAVGGIVGFLSFLNNALSGGTSRFLTFELGLGNKKKLQSTFSTSLTVHILLAVLIVILAETVGLWYFNNKLVIPDERCSAAAWVYHFSILTAIITIISVPYNAAIIAHEHMKVFAYVGIVDAIGRLGIVFLLNVGDIDKLVLYAVLLMLFQLGIFLFYVIYCRLAFSEAKYQFLFIDKGLFKEIFSFSSWGLVAGSAIALNTQGILLLLNYFFAPAVVTARSISLQVYNAANLFVTNFRTAVNPQIIKQLASGDEEGSHRLLLESTKFSYYLMLIICLPICLLASPILHLWLVEVPEYTVPFLQIVIIQSLFQVFDTSFYTALYAKGRIKENALISPMISLLSFPVVCLLFKMGASPLALSWASLLVFIVAGCVLKPLLIVKIAEYRWKDILEVFWVCFKVTVVAVPIPVVLFYVLGIGSIGGCAVTLIASFISVGFSVWNIGLTKSMRKRMSEMIKLNIHL